MIKKSTCVVIDTNTWRSNLLLRTGLGSALLFTINRAKYKLGLPEVVEGEVVKHTEIAAKEAISKIERNFRDIQAIIGKHSPYELPSKELVEEAIKLRFKELHDVIVRVPFSLNHAQSALNRVNLNIPPSSTKKQQFKDAAIWEAMLELAEEYDVLLVTADGDFYEDKSRKTLNSLLKKEIDDLCVVIRVYSSLEMCLKELEKERPQVNLSHLAEDIISDISDQITQAVSSNNLRPTSIESHRINAFITEDHNRLAVEYEIILDAVNTDVCLANEGQPSSVTVEGSCVYNTKKGCIENNRFHSIGANWVNTEGKDQVTKGVYINAGIAYLGRQPDIPYTVKIELHES